MGEDLSVTVAWSTINLQQERLAGGAGVVYRRHPQCPRISLLSSPCTLVKTMQEGRKGLSPRFTNKATEFGGAGATVPGLGPLPPQEPWALPPAPSYPLSILNPAVPRERDGMGQVSDSKGSRQGPRYTHTDRHTCAPLLIPRPAEPSRLPSPLQ